MTASLRVTDLCAWYGPAQALRDVSIEIGENEAVALLGPNGAGKSTLLSCIARLHRRITGTVEILGESATSRSASATARAGTSFVRERAPVVARMTVEENLQLGESLAARRGTEPTDRREIWSCFPMLEERASVRAGLLSGGQRQMLALAIAFASRPRLLLLDEPSAGLSPLVAGPVFAAIEQMRASGVSLLVAEQNAQWVSGLAGRAYALESGVVIGEAPVSRPHTGGARGAAGPLVVVPTKAQTA
jgi:branched-chain amino acid transport system ATP-binding protein